MLIIEICYFNALLYLWDIVPMEIKVRNISPELMKAILKKKRDIDEKVFKKTGKFPNTGLGHVVKILLHECLKK